MWSSQQGARLGLGLAALGRPSYINLGHRDDLAGRREVAALEQHAHVVLDAALAGGIAYFDAARSYGRAEEFLAGWLARRGIAPGEVTVGSKWGYTYTAGWRTDADVHEVKEHSRANLDRQIAQSRTLLGNHLALYQIHSATEESGVLDNDPVMDRLAELRADGLVIGFTTSGPRQAQTIRRALRVERDGSLLFGTVQATWNLLEPSAGPALAEARDAGLGVIVKEALANGRLAHPSSPAATRLRDHGAPDAVALAAALHQPWASVVLSGAASVEHLGSNLAAKELPRVDLPDMSEPPGEYWATRAGLAWT